MQFADDPDAACRQLVTECHRYYDGNQNPLPLDSELNRRILAFLSEKNPPFTSFRIPDLVDELLKRGKYPDLAGLVNKGESAMDVNSKIVNCMITFCREKDSVAPLQMIADTKKIYPDTKYHLERAIREMTNGIWRMPIRPPQAMKTSGATGNAPGTVQASIK